LNLVVAVSTEGRDKKGGVVVKSVVVGDGKKKVMLNIFILGAPDFLASFIDDSILVRVVGDSSGARWGGKKVREELSFRSDGEREVGDDRSGWGWGGDDGNRSFNNGWWEILDGDIGKGDLLNDFLKL
jgi:hypothetical protein